MQGRALHPLAFFLWLPAAVAGILGIWLTLQGDGLAAVALGLLLVALGILVVRPALALWLLVLTRFSFEMFWDQRVYGFSVLDFLGAGVPVAVLVAIFLARPRLAHIPLAKPLLAWAAVLAASSTVFVIARGEALVVLENTLRYTCGIPLFLLTVLVVRDFEQAWRLLRLWLVGALPVAAVFFVYGDQMAMEYHGVVRMKAFYHDVVTPAVVACVAMLIALFLLGLGWLRRWRPHWLILLAAAAVVGGRMLYLTFHNALAGVACLTIFTFLIVRRRFGLLACTLLFVVGMSQVERVQQRWWREIAILQGEEDPIAFASGRPNQWRYYLARYGELEPMDQYLGVHGTWGDPENQFIQLLGDLGPAVGLFTLGILLWILRAVYRWAAQEQDPERRLFFHCVFSLLVGTGAAWLTATPLTYSNFQWFLFCLLGLAVAVERDKTARAAQRPKPPALAGEAR